MPSQYIGEILVHLRADAASWVSGLEQATKEMQKFGRTVERDFRQLGNSLSFVAGTFGAFGAQGAAVAQALTAMGRVAGSTINTMSKWNPVLGVVAGGLGGLATGAVSLGAVLVGTSVHAADAAAQVYHLSQSTGIAAPTLAAFGLAGKAAGLDMETMAKGLERMSKNALVAATSTSTMPSAFARLKVSVVDSKGHLKDVEQLMLEVADKFAAMQDGSYKTALAIQIFGRGGAALIPVLNMGKQGLSEWVNFGKRVGAAMGTDAYRGAKQFHDELVRGEAVISGASNQIMQGMLPALTQLVHSLFDVSSDGKTFVAIGREIGEVMKGAALGVGGLAWALRQLNLQPQLAAVKLDLSKLMRETAGGTRFTLEQGAQIQADKKLIAELETALADADQKWGQLQNDMSTPGKLPAIPKGGGSEEDLTTGGQEKNRKAEGYLDRYVRGHLIGDLFSEGVTFKGKTGDQLVSDALGRNMLRQEEFKRMREEAAEGLPAPELKPLLPSLGPEGAPLLEQQLEKFWEEHGKYTKQGEQDLKDYYAHLEQVQRGLAALGEITQGELSKRLSALHLEEAEILKRNAAEEKQAKRETFFDQPIFKKAEAGQEDIFELEQLARAEIAWGTLGQKVQGVFDMMAAQAKNVGGQIGDVFAQGIDKANDALARFIVTGRGGFLQVLESMSEELTRVVLHWIEFEIAAHVLLPLLNKIFGTSFKMPSGGGGGFANAEAASASKAEAAYAGMAAAKAAAAAAPNPAAMIAAAAITEFGIQGVVLAGSKIAGFLEHGGDVLGGKSYVVGERGPELFVPHATGHVFPNEALESGGPRLSRPAQREPVQNVVNFHVVAMDAASFKDHLDEHRDAIAAMMREHLREANQI